MSLIFAGGQPRRTMLQINALSPQVCYLGHFCRHFAATCTSQLDCIMARTTIYGHGGVGME